MSKPYGTVLIKASKILDFLADTDDETTLKNISTALGMTTSTTLKILDTLQLIGYVTRNNSDKTYYLGPSLAKYGSKYVEHSNIKQIATPILNEFQMKVDETIHLGIRLGYELIYIDKLEPKNQSIFMSSKVGASRPLYSTGMGKIFLSFFSDQELDDYFFNTPLEAYTERTITNKFVLQKELQNIRQEEVAFDDEEMEKDCFCVAMPIIKQENIEASFSVSMPKFRATKETIGLIIKDMKTAKKEIEAQLTIS